MRDLTPLAVPDTMALLTPVLPAPPARVCEVGCGRGALAAALAAAGYRVVGLEPDPESAERARERGVDVRGEALAEHRPAEPYDVILFTRSLHHIADLGGALDHALELLTPDGVLVAEEFARERADRAAAEYLFDTLTLLAAAGAAEPPDDDEGIDDPVRRWHHHFHGHHDDHPAPEHDVADILRALDEHGCAVTTTTMPALWRMVLHRLVDGPAAAPIATTVRALEYRRVADGTLPALGTFLIANRKG
jgi:methyltransferase family protein